MNEFGLIGGTSWHSTVDYYSYINRHFNNLNEDNTNPPLRIVSLNQREIHDCQQSDRIIKPRHLQGYFGVIDLLVSIDSSEKDLLLL